MQLRTIQSHERDQVLDLLAQWYDDREFFARYFRCDPEFRDDLCFVAVEAGRMVATLQVFRKRVRSQGMVLDVGGIANVFTSEPHRGRGLASGLLGMAVEAMARERFDASLLFATRLPFYSRHGWSSEPRHFEFATRAPSGIALAYEARRFEAADLDAIMSIYEACNRDVAGTTVRDRGYWQGQLGYAGNPHEEFLVACSDGTIVAYARGASLYEVYVMMEHGCIPGHEAAVAELMAHLMDDQASGQPGVLTQLSATPRVRAAIEGRGIGLNRIEDYFWMWRVISPAQLAAKLGLSASDVAGEDLFHRLFPPEGSVYWLSDRF